ncbi:YbfB/YjiJ family MFS transporter [Streptomyces sp. NPDC058409]|uniref:YbfB/YjiJ family MFS transporter n=1 Tax=Streptomyces sp. NPDC058409 TaxID=3346484 RepID=UPI0036635F4D
MIPPAAGESATVRPRRLRLLAVLTSALIFVVAASSLLGHLREHPAHLPGWAFGGVGAGIALSGLLVLILRSVADWRAAWWASAGLATVLAAGSWNLRPDVTPASTTGSATGGSTRQCPRMNRWFTALFAGYTLEGIGYIVAGTFLVAAIEQSSPGWAGSGAWVLVGLAVPSSALWAWLGRRRSRPGLLCAALVIQAVGIALPALIDGVAAALISAFLFGATFLGVSTIALAAGAHLRFPRSVALLTTGYSVGQILGPLGVAPLLRHGYHQDLILAAAVAAAFLRIGFPRPMSVMRSIVPGRQSALAETAAVRTDRPGPPMT